MLFLRRRRVHLRRFSPSSLTVHLGEKRGKPCQNPPWYKRRGFAWRSGKFLTDHFLLITNRTAFVKNIVHNLHFYALQKFHFDFQWHPVRPIIASISSGVVSIWSQNQVCWVFRTSSFPLQNWHEYQSFFSRLSVPVLNRMEKNLLKHENKSEVTLVWCESIFVGLICDW